jgi:hypothetical protein
MDTVVNPLFESLMHTDQALAGGLIKGIYPRSTPIQAQGHPFFLEFTRPKGTEILWEYEKV